MYRSRKIQAFAPSKRMRSRSASVAPSRKRAPRRALVKSSYARALTSSTGVGLGPSLKTQLKTVYFTTITTAASGFYSGSLKSGSCYDPTGSFSTVQPAEFDQLAAVFGRYVVLGGYVRVSIVATSSAAGFACCIYPSIESSPKADFQSCASQDNSVRRLVVDMDPPTDLFCTRDFLTLLCLARRVLSLLKTMVLLSVLILVLVNLLIIMWPFRMALPKLLILLL